MNRMTVAKLIAALTKLPQDAVVYDEAMYPVVRVRKSWRHRRGDNRAVQIVTGPDTGED